MKFKYKILFVITPLVFILDQITKWFILKGVPLYGKIEIIPGYFDITHYKNPGAAFGLFAGSAAWFREPFFFIVAVIAVIMLSVFFVRLPERLRLLPVTVSLVFGGIAGNILDRIRFGSVTDFLSVHIRDVVWSGSVLGMNFSIPLDWPSFNVADSAITIAMLLFVISAFKGDGFNK